jgi:MFS family permease
VSVSVAQKVVAVTGPRRAEPTPAEELTTASVGAQRGDATPPTKPFGVRFITPIVISTALNPINTSLIVTALVGIAATMHVSVGKTSILVSSLYVTCAIAQPTAGRLGEEFGPRRILLLGTAIVLAAGLCGAIASSLATLVCARVLIGLGTSAAYPTAMLLIRRRAAEVGLRSPPSGVLSAMAVVAAATLAIGPTLGGMLIGWLGWRTVFVVNVPFACATGLMALRWIPRDPPVGHGRPWRVLVNRLDLPGMAAFGAALIGTLLALTGLPHLRWPALAGAVVSSALLVWRELRAANPFIDVRLLVRNRALSRTYVRSSLTVVGVYVLLYGLTQWIQVGRGQTAFVAGLIMLPMGALSALAAQAVSGRKNPSPLLITSAVLLLVGSALILVLSRSSPILLVAAVTSIFGIMNGANTIGNQLALYRQTPALATGTASGLLRTAQYVGSMASAIITGIAFRHTVDSAGLHHIGVILIGIGAVVLIMTVCDRQLTPSTVDHGG